MNFLTIHIHQYMRKYVEFLLAVSFERLLLALQIRLLFLVLFLSCLTFDISISASYTICPKQAMRKFTTYLLSPFQ